MNDKNKCIKYSKQIMTNTWFAKTKRTMMKKFVIHNYYIKQQKINWKKI